MPGEAVAFGTGRGPDVPLPAADMMPPSDAASPFGAPLPEGPLPFESGGFGGGMKLVGFLRLCLHSSWRIA